MPTIAKPRKARTDRHRRLLELLVDGEFHSGAKLAKRLRISRGAIWKLMHTLRALGIDIESIERRGYRLPRPVDLYNHKIISTAISPVAAPDVERLELFLSIDSTNRHLVNELSAPLTGARVCVAEIQTAGRGRRGRSWTAPFGSGICMSLAWQFAESPPTLSALSLAVGVAVAKALQKLGCTEIGLKWPNDIVWKGRKLAGILIEMRGESAGPAQVVIGIGLNVSMPPDVRVALAKEQALLIADLREALRERTPKRNIVVAAIVDELVSTLKTFAHEGFLAFDQEWQRLDSLAHAPVRVINGSESVMGIANGVDSEGALLVEVNGDIRRFVSGDVSLRPA